MSASTVNTILKVITGLWIIWGLVHVLAAVIVLSSDATGSVQAIADAVQAGTLVRDYPAAVAGILNQHGFNLGWFGVVTIIGALLIWRGSATALWVTAMVGGLADIGYFIFLDMPGFVNVLPGTLMTIVSGSAIVLSVLVWRPLQQSPA